MYYTQLQVLTRIKQLPDFQKEWGGELPSGYWILGKRSADDEPNKFDDGFELWFHDERILETTGTTNPGTVVLQGGYTRYNKDGAAVVAADRIYPKVWKKRLHAGKVLGLCQWSKGVTLPIDYHRDGDGDKKSEEIGKLYSGWVGLNFHPDEYDFKEDDRPDDANIGWWSAGCQVCNNMDDYEKIMELVGDELIDYVLLNEFSI